MALGGGKRASFMGDAIEGAPRQKTERSSITIRGAAHVATERGLMWESAQGRKKGIGEKRGRELCDAAHP